MCRGAGTNDTSFFPDDPSRYATYEDVVLALHSHVAKQKIPVKYVLLDSYWCVIPTRFCTGCCSLGFSALWTTTGQVTQSLCCVDTLTLWIYSAISMIHTGQHLSILVNTGCWCRYEKSTNGGGTKLWAPTLQTFPRGLAWLHNQTGFHWQLHNRYWSSDCDYATQNNGSYEFFIPGSNCSDPLGNLDVIDWQDKECSRPGQFSLPQARTLSMHAADVRESHVFTTIRLVVSGQQHCAV